MTPIIFPARTEYPMSKPTPPQERARGNNTGRLVGIRDRRRRPLHRRSVYNNMYCVLLHV